MTLQEAKIRKYREYLERAKAFERKGNIEEALEYYRLSLSKLREVVKNETHRATKRRRMEIMKVIESKVNALHKEIQTRRGNVSGGSSSRKRDYDSMIDEYDQREFDALIDGCIDKSTITWDDISGLDETKQIIKESVVLAMAQKESGVKIEGWSNILLYGPPGTGKTLLAAATSNGLGATFFNVKIADILSRYVGDSPKILATLFRRAREKAPSVIFIDEIENLVESRDERRQSSTGLVQSFLGELDGFSRKNDDKFVLFIAATNVPWEVDNAILNRFEKRILIPLPDEKARMGILRIHIDKKGFTFKGDLGKVVDATKGYSGRDIRNLCKDVTIRMIREMNPSLPELAQDISTAKEYRIKTRPITEDDFNKALMHFRPTTSKEMVLKIEEWGRKFGSE